MKWKPVLCVAVLALAAGCKSAQQNPYASFGEYGFSFDLEQAPVPGLTVAENERIAHMPSASPTQLLNPPGVLPQAVQPMPGSADSQPAGTAAAATATPTPATTPAQ